MEGRLSFFFTSPPHITPMSESTNSNKKQQLVVTHTKRQTETPALPGSWVTNRIAVKMLRPQKDVSPHIFVKT